MSLSNQFQLLTKRKFLPLFITQFLNALNDNIFRNSIVVLITYRIAEKTHMNSGLLVTITTGLFVLPFLLFSAVAGQVADKYEKSKLIRIIQITEVFLMILGGIGFLTTNLFLLMFTTFMVSVRATSFGPLKYAILPQLLDDKELLYGNGLVSASTFIAILLGSILGGILVLKTMGTYMVSILIVLVAFGGLISSLFIPRASSSAADLKVNYNIFSETWRILAYSTETKKIFVYIIGISWFWWIGTIFMTQLPLFVKNTIGADQNVYLFFLTLFSIGVAMGSILYNYLSRGKIHEIYVLLAAIGITLFILDLLFSSQKIILQDQAKLLDMSQFLIYGYSWRISMDLLLISILGGIYIVPLYTLLQVHSEESHRSRIIASNNIMGSLFMVIASLFCTVMLAMHFSVTDIFLATAVANIFMALYLFRGC